MMTYRARLSLVTAVGLCALTFGLLSCSNTQTAAADASKKPLDVRVLAVQPSTIARTLEVTGSVVPFRAVQLASPAEGPVVSLRVRQGDRVRKGDTLLVIGRQEGTEAQIASLLENVHKEEANLARVKRLFEIKGISREQLEQAQTVFELTKAQLVKAQESARDFSVIAPWDGVTSQLFTEVGDYNYTNPRRPLIELYDPASLVVRISVPEQYAAHLKYKTPVLATLDAYPDTVFEASISRIYPYLDERMRTRTVEATITGNVNLMPGMFARTKLQAGLVEGAIVVPTEAIITATDGSSNVFIIHDGKAQRRMVRTGIENAGRVQIIGGIKSGDSMIVTGIMSLSDGRQVRAVDNVPAGNASQMPTAQRPPKTDTTASSDGRR